MNKSQLIDVVAEKAELSRAAADSAVNALIGAIADSLSNNDPVTIVGFGTFSTRDRAARAGRNPRTGETIQIAASTLPVFKAGKALKDAVG